MKKTEKFILSLFVSMMSVGLFWWLESGFNLRNGYELIKSSIFAVSLFIVLTGKYKIFILWIALIQLVIMIALYLFWQIPLSSFFGSVGFGMFLIFIFGHLPQLIKNGFVQD